MSDKIIQAPFVKLKPISELENVVDPLSGKILYYDDGGSLKTANISTFKDIIVSGIKGKATPSSSPTAWTSGDPDLFEKWDVNTAGTYTHFIQADTNPLMVSSGDLTTNFVQIWVKNGVSEKVLSVKPPGVSVASVFDSTNSTDAQGGKQINDFFYPKATTLSTTTWNVNTEKNKTLLLSGNRSIELFINDGVEGFLMIEGSGTVLIANKSIAIGSKPMLIGVKRMGSTIFALSKEITESISPINEGQPIIFSGSGIINNSNIWEASVKDNNWGHLGIDSGILNANTAGRIWFRYFDNDAGGCLGFTTGITAVGFGNMTAGFWKNSTPNTWGKTDSGTVSQMSTVPAEVGYFYGIYRDVNGNFYWQSSPDAIIWTTLHTFTSVNTGALRAVCDIRGNIASVSLDRITQPKKNY